MSARARPKLRNSSRDPRVEQKSLASSARSGRRVLGQASRFRDLEAGAVQVCKVYGLQSRILTWGLMFKILDVSFAYPRLQNLISFSCESKIKNLEKSKLKFWKLVFNYFYIYASCRILKTFKNLNINILYVYF